MRPLWNAEDMLNATGGVMAEKFAATGVSIDSRTLEPGDLFIALVGETGDGRDHVAAGDGHPHVAAGDGHPHVAAGDGHHHVAAGDGHHHVAAAFAKGAAGALVHRAVPGAKNLLVVDDTLAALNRLGAFARSRFPGRMAAITGSVGKTTTKEMLRTILAGQGKTHAAAASYNNHWGVPLTLARLPPDAVYGIVEIGMNHAGEIEPLANLAQPHVAVITAIAPAHIGNLGSLDAIAEEKLRILRGLRPDGIAVVTADSPGLRAALVNSGAQVVLFGRALDAHARLLDAVLEPGGTDVHALVAGHELRFRLAVPGLHMAMNAVGALTAAAALGADPVAGAEALRQFAAVDGRGARETLRLAAGGEALLLDESYNASGASIRAALAVLKLQPASRRIAVLGDILELGAHAATEHASLVQAVADAADLVFACGPLMRRLFDALPAEKRGAHKRNSADLAPIIAAALAPGDAVLVKGSLGSRMKVIVQALRQPAGTGLLRKPGGTG